MPFGGNDVPAGAARWLVRQTGLDADSLDISPSDDRGVTFAARRAHLSWSSGSAPHVTLRDDLVPVPAFRVYSQP
jgi:hypothetical protein